MGYAPGGGHADTEQMAASAWLSWQHLNKEQMSRQKTQLPKTAYTGKHNKLGTQATEPEPQAGF